MTKSQIGLLAAGMISLSVISCSKKKDEPVAPINYANTAFNSISLSKDDAVLRNLNTVFFSIDMIDAKVFNADSLPKGTGINALTVAIDKGTLSSVKLRYKGADDAEKTVENDSTDKNNSNKLFFKKVDFSKGPVNIDVISYDGKASRTYTMQVNVHKVEADLFYWTEAASAKLPTNLTTGITDSKSVEYKSKPYVFTTDGTRASLATCSDLSNPQWQFSTPTLPQDADLATITASSDNLWMIAGDKLYKSADGLTWTSTGVAMSWIYGMYGDTVIGNVRKSNGSYVHVTYPGGERGAVAADCPVSGTSAMLGYTGKWLDSPVVMTVGGKKSDGSMTGATWSYDGTNWASTSLSKLPEAEGMTLLPYYIVRTSSSSWKTTKLEAMLALGGRKADGSLSRTVYYTTDYGLHWNAGDKLMQLPDQLPSFAFAQSIIVTRTLHTSTRNSGIWTPMETQPLAPWMLSSATRASEGGVAPITEWECPYIYLLGGVNADDEPVETIWRGVLNRLTFKPIQ